MGLVIERMARHGRVRLDSKLKTLGCLKFTGMDLTLVRRTHTIEPGDVWARFIGHGTIDAHTGKRKPVPINDTYFLLYRLRPSGKKLAEHTIADRDYHYTDADGFEREVHYQVGMILEKIRGRFPAADICLRLPDEDDPRKVDDTVIDELKGSLNGPVAVLSTMIPRT